MCEPGVPGSPHRCGGNCRYLELCDTSGVPVAVFTAGDALDILRTAVGVSSSCSSAPRCDLDAGGSVTAIDAQMALRMAVGSLKGICAPVQSIRFRVGKGDLMSVLQINLDFDPELGSFRSATGRVVCTNPFSNALLSAGEPEPGWAILGVISFLGFSSDDNTIDCKFYRSGDKPVAPSDFYMYVDATDTLDDPVTPAPVVTISTP
jgi:hypothetical protein